MEKFIGLIIDWIIIETEILQYNYIILREIGMPFGDNFMKVNN